MTQIKQALVRFAETIAAQRFFVLNLLLGLICFIILPTLIIHRGFDALISKQATEQEEFARQKLADRLDQLEFFSANDRFAHFLLHSVCQRPNGEPKSKPELERNIARLKEQFPGAFTFVVADRSGKLIKGLSDESGFSYLYRQAFSLIADAKTANVKQQSSSIIKDIDARLTRLRPLLGEFIKIDDLLLPLQSLRNGKSILASGGGSKFHIWYGNGKDFELIAFIDRSFIKSHAGLQWSATKLNLQDKQIVSGFTQYPPSAQSLFPRVSPIWNAKIISALAENELFGTENNQQYFITSRFIDNTWRAFSYYRDGQPDIKTIKAHYGSLAIKFLLICLFILTIYCLKNPITLTVKLKISAFFAYAICLPLLIIGSLASQYIDQAEIQQVNKLKKDCQRIIEKLDEGYDWYITNLSRNISVFLTGVMANQKPLLNNDKAAQKFVDQLASVCEPGEVMVINSSGKDLVNGTVKASGLNLGIVKNLGYDALKLFKEPNYNRQNKYPIVSRHLARDMYYKQDKINYLGMGEVDIGAFYKLLNQKQSHKNSQYFCAIFWQASKLQRKFFQEYWQQALKSRHLQVAFMCKDSKQFVIFPDASFSPQLRRLINTADERKTPQAFWQKQKIGGHIAIAMPGISLYKLCLAAILPTDIIYLQKQKIIMKAWIFAGLLCLIIVVTMFLLRNWIFKPLDELRAGIEAIGKRNFHKRLNLVCNNELGRLMNAFNNSLETLQDLEVARIVQESILPDAHTTLNNIEVVANSQMMTELGGDYFDMVKLDDRRLLLFIGDATGHGIPAALSMAMAKSIITHENLGKLDQKKLINQFNTVFGKLRASGAKDFMTALCAEICTVSGAISFVNAGHCYPILLQRDAKKGETLSHIRGLPPGFVLNCDPQIFNYVLKPGDSLFLFTDGFIECINRNECPLGFDGLTEIVATAYDCDPTKHLQQVFQELKNWSAEPQDDCTMLLARYK